jgi:thiol:disulfide interchange protein
MIVLIFAVTLAVQTTAFSRQSSPPPQIYQPTQITPGMLAHAIKTAREQNKFLMVEFGANWCEDCVALARNLEQGETRDYFEKHFVILKVDVGRFDRNLDLAKSIGVDLDKGIPTAVFFAPDGNKVGATNKGELEPARKYGNKQIYAFLKEIAERRVITVPGFK